MSDEPEEGPDPNDIRRHAKKMFTEMQYRQKYRRIDYYRPNDKQREFHNSLAREVMLRAGNQNGKTHAAGAQMVMDALSLYPDWYEGRRFLTPPKIERPIDFMGWFSCTTSEKVRDGAQAKLFGPIREAGGLGTGLIPLDNIVGRPTMARGISDLIDTAMLRRETGGKAQLRGKSYADGRESFQGEPVDLGWLDEDIDIKEKGIYGECLARLITTDGKIIVSMSPLLGQSPLRLRFIRKEGGSIEQVDMTLYDCVESKGGHIPDARLPEIIASIPENERATRIYGSDMQGQGAVFSTPVERIKHHRDPSEFPTIWRWLWGLDFSHGGMSIGAHPFAAVLGAHDILNDIVYIVNALKMDRMLPANHVDQMKRFPWWEAPCAWPHDGGTHTAHGITLAKTYKNLGLNMLPSHATFPEGGYNFESGVEQMEQRFASGRLLVARHLAPYFDEYLNYHKEDGIICKVHDDLLSATRQLVMQLRSAKPIQQARMKLSGAASFGVGAVAEGLDFPLG